MSARNFSASSGVFPSSIRALAQEGLHLLLGCLPVTEVLLHGEDHVQELGLEPLHRLGTVVGRWFGFGHDSRAAVCGHEGQAFGGPGLHAPVEVLDVEALAGQVLCRLGTAAAAATDGHHGPVAVELVDPIEHVVEGDVTRVLDVAGLPLVRVANVDDLELVHVTCQRPRIHLSDHYCRPRAPGDSTGWGSSWSG